MQKMFVAAAARMLLAGCMGRSPMAASSASTANTPMPSGLGAGSVASGGSTAGGAGTAG